ncbi:MAG: 5'/3'-nucleotidase SurE [Candidatus Marinimicrobia bacterium]|nr:5'/3'-nucleotidase SurE [Candidatus Neomarinimicrobiota bacterium]MCF7922135.1 5'/3'-nucleotidase SurE [Candidatus Neomarinimicrobiota bacterium]
MPRPRILLTNDDGINARGIKTLAESLSDFAEISIVAPLTEMSAMGHAITISDPLKVTEIFRKNVHFGWAVGGTPADCVKIAIHGGLVETPDLVISGINQGANVGVDIIYSGTVSAAYEGTILGIPSMAISLDSFVQTDFHAAAKIAHIMSQKILEQGLPKGTLLNVNVPAGEYNAFKGFAITRQGSGTYKEKVDRREDPRKRVYYWLSGKRSYDDTDPEMDENAVREGFVAITPLHYELTNKDYLESLASWNLNLG